MIFSFFRIFFVLLHIFEAIIILDMVNLKWIMIKQAISWLYLTGILFHINFIV